MLPGSIRDLITKADTRPCQPVRDDYPYRRYHRSIAAVLLCGRVGATFKGPPNLTDANRLCKEGNFNVYAFQVYSELLLEVKAIEPHNERYQRGKQWDPFFSGDLSELRKLTRHALGTLVDHHTPSRAWRSTMAWSAHLDTLLLLFCAALQGVSIRDSEFSSLLRAFTRLPVKDLIALAEQHGVTDLSDHEISSWADYWLDDVGVKALMAAVTCLHWFAYNEHGKGEYILPSYTGRVMLGLEEPLRPHAPALDFAVQADLSVLAGEDLPFETLVPLFRGCKIKRIDRIIQFQLSAKHLAAVPGKRPAAEELRQVFRHVGPLPDTVDRLLGGQKKIGGSLAVRACNGLVRVDDPALLDTIRSMDRLKGYVERAGPPGYLVIKPGSSLETFLERCQQYGLTIQPL